MFKFCGRRGAGVSFIWVGTNANTYVRLESHKTLVPIFVLEGWEIWRTREDSNLWPLPSEGISISSLFYEILRYCAPSP